MIAALIAVLFLAGGGALGYIYDIDKIETGVKTLVKDEPRRSEALEILESMKTNNSSYADSLAGVADEWQVVLSDQVATDTNLDAIWKQYLQDMDDFQREFVDLRFELKEQLNREEWAAIFPEN